MTGRGLRDTVGHFSRPVPRTPHRLSSQRLRYPPPQAGGGAVVFAGSAIGERAFGSEPTATENPKDSSASGPRVALSVEWRVLISLISNRSCIALKRKVRTRPYSGYPPHSPTSSGTKK